MKNSKIKLSEKYNKIVLIFTLKYSDIDCPPYLKEELSRAKSKWITIVGFDYDYLFGYSDNYEIYLDDLAIAINENNGVVILYYLKESIKRYQFFKSLKMG